MTEKKDSGCRFCRWACDNAAKISNYIITPCKWVLDKIRQATYYAFYKIFLLGFVLVLLISGGIFAIFVEFHDDFDDYILNCAEQSLKPKIKCPPQKTKTEEDSDKQQSPVDTNTGGISNEEKIIGLSNIRRNYFILFFAIFAGGLASWARFAHHQQLKHTEKQIEISRDINRNDRFAKASEMLGKDKSATSHRGGIYMLRDLVKENPENEYIRCVEVIIYWLKEKGKGKGKDIHLVRTGVETFTAERIESLPEETRQRIIAKHKKEYKMRLWPDFKDVDLRWADLAGANLESARLRGTKLEKVNMAFVILEHAGLHGAVLDGAFVANAEMRTATGLKKEQILKATWKDEDGYGEPPELPEDLMKDPNVQEWLEKPPFRYKYD